MDEQGFRLCFTEGFEEGELLCRQIAKVALGNSGRIGVRVAIDPPIAPNKYMDSAVEFLVLTAFFAGATILPICEWPLHVRVFVPMVNCPEHRDRFESDELFMLAFGLLRPTTA